MSGTNVKKRYWAAVVYPESAPQNWLDIVQQTGLPVAVSPLHDKDVDPTGEPKKPHWHLILCYNAPTTYNNVLRVTGLLNAPVPVPLDSVKGYYRYLTHQDNPDKAQYAAADIRHLNGFNPLDYMEMTAGDRLRLIRSVQEIVQRLELYEYAALLDFLKDSDSPEEYLFAASNTVLFEAYLRSRRYIRQSQPPEADCKN